ncbi:MAG: signal peptidase II [Anaerolineaceae bacterium]|nr:signal peptidase II [Anaerolineaceae bacterium]MDD4042188.1 signal peptidase II [Anaerolineaceae bacterium]MDD4577024.1 signal peptidase II [Anaerolineaceae bacterium]
MRSSKNWIGNYLLLFGIASIIVIFDQWSKGWIRQNVALGEEIYPISFLEPFFRFTFWQNTGAALGIFQNANIPLLVLTTIISILIIWYYHKAIDEPLLFRISLGLLLGGAVGNIIDRIQLGYVTDFIAVGRFPVFNVADSAVTIGVILMLIGLFVQERKEKAAKLELEVSQEAKDEN